MTADARSATADVADAGPSVHRERSAGVHFDALDGYRAVAALLVVTTHVAFNTGLVGRGGLGSSVLARFDVGVALFFLMSGFLLYRPWARAALEGRARPGIRRYAVRRAARILPLYWLVVVVTLALLPEIQPVPAADWWRHLLAVQIYTPSGSVEGLTQTWSLCTEIAFYAALPVLGLLGLGRRRDPSRAWRRQLVLVTALVVLATGWNVAVHVAQALPTWTGTWLPAYADWFAAGMLLALVEVRSRLPSPPALVRVLQSLARDQWTSIVLALSLFLVAATPAGGPYDLRPSDGWDSLTKHWLYLLAAGCLLLPGVLGGDGPVSRGMSARVPHRLGLISYGIFLWHLVVLRAVLDVLDIPVFSGKSLLVGTLTLATTLAVSTATYVTVERPAQRWAHRR